MIVIHKGARWLNAVTSVTRFPLLSQSRTAGEGEEGAIRCVAQGYNFFMARGWESKSVEQQQDEAVSDQGQRKVQLSAEQAAEERRREALWLSRKRILQQLEVATNPRHREMLEAALAELERQLQ
jgi:hypothetical protein